MPITTGMVQKDSHQGDDDEGLAEALSGVVKVLSQNLVQRDFGRKSSTGRDVHVQHAVNAVKWRARLIHEKNQLKRLWMCQV